MRAIRVPRGAAGFGRALLRYVATSEGKPAGLELVPLAPEFPEGVLLS